MLSKLGVNSELYRYKMDQYKELSTVRAEIEKVLQEQRLDKIRRDFEKQKYEDERRYNHEKWMEDQKREILAAKLRNNATKAGNSRGMSRAYSQPDLNTMRNPKSAKAITAYPQPQTSRYENPETRNSNAPNFMNGNITAHQYNDQPQYDPPNMPMSTRNRAPDTVHFNAPRTRADDGIPDTVIRDNNKGLYEDTNGYNPKVGLGIHFDFITALERQHRDVRLVYGIFNYKKVVVTNREVGIMQSEADPNNMSRNRVFINKKHILKGVKPHAGNNIIMEFQVRRTDTEPGDVRYASIGWTLMNLFDSNYDLMTGQFKCPLYATPTQPDLDVRDIPKLKKIEKVMICLRIAVPKDPIAKIKIHPDAHPGNYSIPRIHTEILDKEAHMNRKRKMEQLQDNNIPKKIAPEEGKRDQEAYECSGINVFIHYIKNYEPTGLLRIKCTLYEGPKLLRDNNGQGCQFATRVVHPEEAIVANQDNMEKLNKIGVYIYSEKKYGKKDIVVPINDDKSWLRDFYTMLWDNQLQNDIYLQVELLVKENPYKGGTFRNLKAKDPDSIIHEYSPIAATMVKCNNYDGTLRYGSYELPFFEYPIDRSDPKKNKELPYLIKVTVGQPVNHAENVPNDLFHPQNVPSSLFRKPEDFKDSTNFPKRNPNAENPDPFIPNEKSQVQNSLFKDDTLILYVDGARFLPENTSFSRVVVTLYTSKGNEVARHIIGNSNIQKSTAQHPYFGLREEFSKITHPNMDPTMIAVFKVETFDRANGEQRVVGFSFFPIFMDKNIKAPVRKQNEKKFILNNGNYQLPMFSEKPDFHPPLLIEELTKLEKLPCSTLLIRIEKAPRGENGRPLKIKGMKDEQKYELGLVTLPPKYSQGVYNTMYCTIGITEAEILNEKSMRPDPPMTSVIKETKRLLKIQEQLSMPELRVAVEKAFDDFKASDSQKMMDYNFFSQYIPRIGLRFAVEMMFNTEPKQLYLAVVSVNPPASIYQRHPKFEKAILFTDIDFDSPWSAQAFNELLFTLKNMPSDPKTTFIIDIKAVKFYDKGVAQLDSYAWTCIPMFNILQAESNYDTVELYVNTGIYTLPLFDGPVVADFINTVAKQPRPYDYILEQLHKEVPPIRIKDFNGVIVK